jgi:hypothetical protein
VVDPETFDLDGVVFGETTAGEVLQQLIQGGGAICASLDVTGATISAVLCPEPCDADAGTLTADADVVCLEDGEAVLEATADGNAVVPEGYTLIHVLTQGAELVIISVDAEPTFTVEQAGAFTIHTLVYDPNTLDLSIVEPGVTTGFDVNALLIQGGGEICGSLDVAGAAFTVEVCEDACEGGEVFAGNNQMFAEVCINFPSPVEFSTTSSSEEEYAFVLTNDADAIIAPIVGNVFDFEGTPEGTYRVWGISFNGMLTGLTPGTAIADIGTTGDCVEISSTFVTVFADFCGSVPGLDGNAFSLFPNPTDGLLHLRSAGAAGLHQLEVFDLTGRNVHAERLMVNPGEVHVLHLPGSLATGQYIVRLTGSEGRHEQRVIVR